MSAAATEVATSRGAEDAVGASPSRDAWRTRRHYLAASVLVLLVLCGGTVRLVPGVTGVTNDDGIYVATAKALAEGRGYRQIALPGAPPQTKYPIFYPAVLSIIWLIWPAFPANVVAMQALSLLAAALAVALAYLYLIRFRYCSPPVAFAGCALCATSPTYLYFGTLALSEMSFAVLVVLALWKIDSELEVEDNSSRRRSLLAGVCAALPVLCRTVGISLLGVFAGLFILRRKRARAFAVGAVLIILPWMLWSAQNWGVHNDSERYYTDYIGWWAESSRYLPRVVAQNIVWVLSMTSRLPLEGLSTGLLLDSWILLLALGIAAWTYIGWNTHPRRSLPLALIGYGIIVVLWPWPPTRFLVPLLSFFAAFLISTPEAIARRVAGRMGSRVVLASAFLACVINAAGLGRLARESRHYAYPVPNGVFAAEPPAWTSFQALFQWLNANTERTDILASGFDSMMYLYTGRTASMPWVLNPATLYYQIPGLPLGSVDAFAAGLRQSHSAYVVQVPMLGYAGEAPLNTLIDELWTTRPGCLTERYRQPDDRRFAVFRVNAERCAPDARSADPSAATASRDRR